MKPVTRFQALELVLIPITFGFSQLLMILFGLSIIGDDIWSIIGIPVAFGAFISLVFLIVYLQSYKITEFVQLESFFRLLTIFGGLSLIGILLFQFIIQISDWIIIQLLSLIIAIIGSVMTGMCIYFLWKLIFTQNLLE